MKFNCSACGELVVMGQVRCAKCSDEGRTDTTFFDLIGRWEEMKRDGTLAAAEQYVKHLIEDDEARADFWKRNGTAPTPGDRE